MLKFLSNIVIKNKTNEVVIIENSPSVRIPNGSVIMFSKGRTIVNPITKNTEASSS